MADSVERRSRLRHMTVSEIVDEAVQKVEFISPDHTFTEMIDGARTDSFFDVTFANYNAYYHKSEVTLDSYRERAAKNFLIRETVFQDIAESRGYIENSSDVPVAILEESFLACLTEKSDFAFIGPHAFKEKDAYFGFKRIPLTRNSKAKDVLVPYGTSIDTVPKRGSSLLVHCEGLPLSSQSTSPLIEIFRKTADANPIKESESFGQTIVEAYQLVNKHTGLVK